MAPREPGVSSRGWISWLSRYLALPADIESFRLAGPSIAAAGRVTRRIGLVEEGLRSAVALPWMLAISAATLYTSRPMALPLLADPPPLRTDANGVVRVAGTRVTLDTVVGAFLDGATAEEIAQRYPSLQLSDIYAVIAYYLRRRGEVDEYLRDREAQGEALRREYEVSFDQAGIRDRLLARRLTSEPERQ